MIRDGLATPTVSPAAMNDEDIDLWKAVAERRDRDAFETLYRRHEQAAYALAFHITRHREEAQEAVQEALVRAWSAAPSFRAEGSVRGWLLRIVARESLRRIRDRRKEPEAMAASESRAEQEGSPASTAERGELLAALRRRLDALPGADQQLLALHFGGGLSQEEIGAALESSQQTISLRIKKLIERLRSELFLAGLAAPASVLGVEILREAFHIGPAVPPGLTAKVMSGLATAARTTFRRAAVAKASSSGATAVIWAVCAAATAAAGGALWWKARETAAPPAAPPPAAAPAKRPDLYRKWSAKDGPATDLEVVQGSWTWRPGDGRAAAAWAPPPKQYVHLLIPGEIPAQPLLIAARVRVFNPRPEQVGSQLFWCDGRLTLENRIWLRSLARPMPKGFSVVRFYAFDSWIVTTFEDEPWAVQEFSRPFPGTRFALGLNNFSLEELELRTLRPEEIPARVRSPRELAESFGVPVRAIERGTVRRPVPEDK